MVKLALDAITSFSVKPLVLAAYLAVLSGLLSVSVMIYAVVGWMSGEAALGWASLMVVLCTMSCLQFVMLGIQGQYLGRLYEQSKGRPLFIIDRIERQEAVGQSQEPRGAGRRQAA
jgi:dolichol-phosphate mannosyltransferase